MACTIIRGKFYINILAPKWKWPYVSTCLVFRLPIITFQFHSLVVSLSDIIQERVSCGIYSTYGTSQWEKSPKNSLKECFLLSAILSKMHSTDCFFGDFAHWVRVKLEKWRYGNAEMFGKLWLLSLRFVCYFLYTYIQAKDRTFQNTLENHNILENIQKTLRCAWRSETPNMKFCRAHNWQKLSRFRYFGRFNYARYCLQKIFPAERSQSQKQTN